LPDAYDHHVGFTGSRNGEMPDPQADAVLRYLAGFCTLHHGDCIGRDAHAHRLARQLGMLVEIHPPIYGSLRAFCAADYANKPRRFLTRNRFEEQLRSGTWATVRYAQQMGKRVIVVFPDGSVSLQQA
jgi:hypothetical protein